MRSFAIVCALAVAPSFARGDASVMPQPAARPSAITQAQLDVLDKLIAATPDESPEKADLLFRRAVMYLDLAQSYAAVATPEAQQKAERWRLAGIKALLELVDNPRFAAYSRIDEVEFLLADTLTRVHKEDAARKFFKRLIVDHPTSRFIPNAFLSFGEYYFLQSDCENALKFYDKVMQYPDAPVRDYAQYKAGWCYFNMSDFKQALAEFVTVAHGARDERLKREARKDAVRVYAKLGAPRDKARPFFEKIAPPEEVDGLLARLDELLHEEGRDQDSTR
jgi:tetratricopeptide (TPR) repeat protein